MKKSPRIKVSQLPGSKKFVTIIRRDLKTPNRIYCEFPRYASLTHDEAILLANRLADVIEQEGY